MWLLSKLSITQMLSQIPTKHNVPYSNPPSMWFHLIVASVIVFRFQLILCRTLEMNCKGDFELNNSLYIITIMRSMCFRCSVVILILLMLLTRHKNTCTTMSQQHSIHNFVSRNKNHTIPQPWIESEWVVSRQIKNVCKTIAFVISLVTNPKEL